MHRTYFYIMMTIGVILGLATITMADEAVFDFTAPPKTNMQLTEELSFGARIEVEYEHEGNFNLDSADKEDESFIESALSMSFLYEPDEEWNLFVNLEPSYFSVDDEDNKKRDTEKLEIIQAYLSYKSLSEAFEMTLGRQRFSDDREWIYDDELDGLRLVYYFPQVALDASISRENRKDLLGDDDPDKIWNYMLHGRMVWFEDHNAGIYVFKRDDRESADEDPLFLGLHMNGELDKRLQYWLNLAYVDGKKGSMDIRGYGGDFGLTYEFDAPLKPSITAGYAYGSGDDNPNDTTDENFRQTGLQDNDAKLNGVARVKTYGELFDPELSNLSIYTLGVGIQPTKKSSLELVYHYYHQNEASTSLGDSEIDKDPNGTDKDLGHELDIVAGLKLGKSAKASVAVGYFRPGDAFGEGADDAVFVEAKLRFSF